jgi:UDP-3-O-[3-hydroxymyristoyl] N-acetylglucosamine deacetylase
MRQGVLLSTTEHLLSVFYSMGIDNAFVEIDNLEVPILDGSGLPFVSLIREAGIRQYRRKRRYLRIRRPILVEDKSKRISIVPADSFRLTCETEYPSPVGRQSWNWSNSREYAPAGLRAYAGWSDSTDANMG